MATSLEEQKGLTNNASDISPPEATNSVSSLLTEPSSDEISAPVYGPLLLTTDNCLSTSDTTTGVTCYNKDVPDPDAVCGRCGLYNLGNTCFMNSGLQCLLSSAPLVRFLFNYKLKDQSITSTLLGQFHELFEKVWSGKYSIIHPRDFKQTLGLYHPQFQDYRQHDCQEFLALLLDTLHEQLNYSRPGPSNQISELGPTLKPPPDESDVSMNNQSSTSLVSDRNEDQLRNSTGSHSSLTFENIKHGEKQVSSSNETNEVKIESIDTEKDVNSSNLVSFTPNVISEESNHSTASGYSSDSEQCSVIKNLNLRTSPVASLSNGKLSPKSMNEDFSREGCINISSSLDCMKKNEEVGLNSFEEDLHGVRKKTNQKVIQNIDSQSVSIDTAVKLKRVDSDIRDYCVEDCDTKSVLDNTPNMSSDQINEPVILNNALASTSVHTLDDIYAKETKTLNLNVLADEFLSESVTVDSDKFMKQDNTSVNHSEFIEEEGILNNILEASAKKDDDPNARPIKDVNLRADKKSKLSNTTCASNVIQNLDRDDYDRNGIKRMKFEGTEKNLQMQEFSKINKERLIFGTRRVNMEAESAVDVEGDSDSDASENQDGEMDISDDEDETDGGETEMIAAGTNFTTSEVVAAEAAWQKYLSKNDSVIVDTFQGQFKSTVICSECSQVSVTFEPFMYLSVPIPHAMERQLCVIFISSKSEPVRYLLNLNKHDKIQKVKQELCNLIGRQDCDIILAEVLDWHISRILEDNSMLRYVNDSSRKIYAFELEPLKAESVSGDMEKDMIESFDTTFKPEVQENKENPEDVFSHMESFNADSYVFDGQTSFSNFDDTVSVTNPAGTGFDTNQSGMTLNSDLGLTSDPQNSDIIGTNMWEWSERAGDQISQSSHEWTLGDNTPSASMDISDIMETGKDEKVDTGTVINNSSEDKWKSCAICLEELTDNELMVHTSCGGTFCPSCLEMSIQHYGEASYCCPVCSTPADMSEDFVPLANAASHKPKTRIVSIPITFRYETDSCGRPNLNLFAHPFIMNLPSNLTGEYIYSRVRDIMPVPNDFRVVLTDGQGLHCSRCLYMEHCSGCEILRDGEAILRPGDHLTVCVQEVTQNQIEHAQSFRDHESMEKQRSNEPVTLLDCFGAFTQSEDLDEHNPWFCPQCQRNQLAKKTMTVWQYPDTLIIQLKRFVFHQLSGTKVDSVVQFPIDNLDLNQYISGPKTKFLQYNLYSCVCHFGGANSGHYTAYAKHPVSGQWYYYNDETVSLQSPGEDDFSSTYVLFYQRKGTDRAVQIPDNFDIEESDKECVTSHVTSVPDVIHEPPEREITWKNKEQEKSETEPGESLDFYS